MWLASGVFGCSTIKTQCDNYIDRVRISFSSDIAIAIENYL
jgi:hypothetical protein